MKLATILQTGLGSMIGRMRDFATTLLIPSPPILRRLSRSLAFMKLHLDLIENFVERFLFVIYYFVAATHVEVVAILDCRRDPRQVEERLGRTNL